MEELILLVSADPELYDKSSLWTKVLKKLSWILYIDQEMCFFVSRRTYLVRLVAELVATAQHP